MKFKITEANGRYYIYVKQMFFSKWDKLNPNDHLTTTQEPKPLGFRNYFITLIEAQDYADAYYRARGKHQETTVKAWER